MFTNIGSGIRFQPGNKPFFSIFKNSPQTLTLTLTMATLSSSSSSPTPNNRRPTCPSCSRPTRFCLCTRFKTPILDNSIAVTILQHSLEKKHPLNSAKIATLGLKNVDLASISDVISEAHFELHFLESNLHLGHDDSIEIRKKIESLQPSLISFTIEKKGVVKSLTRIRGEIEIKTRDFDEILVDRVAIEGIRNGFTVKKTQRNRDQDYVQDFEIGIPPRSVLLFPSEDSIGIEDIDFDIKNVIVLDGTWSKATKMYKENPWLKLMPHVKLDIEKLSLYGEVRRQPKAGCLSSIESIVYALKAIGEDLEGLDCLLDVFESMVVDQRRCKNERLEGNVELDHPCKSLL